jgi:hypothetical protein
MLRERQINTATIHPNQVCPDGRSFTTASIDMVLVHGLNTDSTRSVRGSLNPSHGNASVEEPGPLRRLESQARRVTETA